MTRTAPRICSRQQKRVCILHAELIRHNFILLSVGRKSKACIRLSISSFTRMTVTMGSSASATAPTVQPSARTLPKKPLVSSLREIPAALKTDTTQFALPEIKTKEYIRKKRKKQNLVKEETSSIGNAAADSETFSPVIRTRETVREQQKLHVSHSAEQEQPVMPQKPCLAKRRQLLQSRLQLSFAKGRYFEIRRSKRQKSQRKPERRFCGQSRQRQKSWPQLSAQAARLRFPLLW